MVVTVLALAACQPSESASPSAAPTGSEPPASEAPETTLQIAYLSFAVANSYDAPMLAAARTASAALNVELTVLDANNSVDAQFAQLQDALTSGQYDGIIVQPIFGGALADLITQGIEDGMPIGILDQDLNVEIEGLSADVTFDQSEIGRKQGELTVQACEEFALDPCNVGYLFNIKVSALDQNIRAAFDEVIADHPQISVVAEGEAFFNVASGQAATADMLTQRSDINVLVGADQGITGGITSIANAGLTEQITLIGYGGAGIAYNRIAAGEQYATVAQLPASEGAFVVEDLVAAIRSGTPSAPRDPVDELPDDGVVTDANVSDFVAEWPG
jgi:ribose transport system substrate-binding protein